MEQEQQTQNVTEHTTENGRFFPQQLCMFLYVVIFADLQVQNQHLEMEKKKMREEFDSQRAKMKELFLQKEGSCSLIATFANANGDRGFGCICGLSFFARQYKTNSFTVL